MQQRNFAAIPKGLRLADACTLPCYSPRLSSCQLSLLAQVGLSLPAPFESARLVTHTVNNELLVSKLSHGGTREVHNSPTYKRALHQTVVDAAIAKQTMQQPLPKGAAPSCSMQSVTQPQCVCAWQSGDASTGTPTRPPPLAIYQARPDGTGTGTPVIARPHEHREPHKT